MSCYKKIPEIKKYPFSYNPSMHWIAENLKKVRKRKPLVHNITNFVVMNSTANALLAVGASPVMAHAQEELEDMLSIADALVINMGTLDEEWVRAMVKAIDIAGEMKKPVVFDPVGAGATRYRTETALRLLKTGNISLLRGNFSEIRSLMGKGKTRGVDSYGYNGESAKNTAISAADEFNTVVAVTGKTDYVSDGKRVFKVMNGTSLLSRVTGTGCMVTSLMGAFVAVDTPLRAAVSALVVFGVASEKAYEETPYPGSFHVKIYDWLYRIDAELLNRMGRVEEIESKR